MLLGSLLIPWIVGRSSKQAAVADTRLKQALQVMATSNRVDATINKIETAFEGFENSLLIEQQDEFLRRREDLRNRVYKLLSSSTKFSPRRSQRSQRSRSPKAMRA